MFNSWRSLYTGHVDVHMISKTGQDFHYLPVDILLIQEMQKNNIRKKKKLSPILFG